MPEKSNHGIQKDILAVIVFLGVAMAILQFPFVLTSNQLFKPANFR